MQSPVFDLFPGTQRRHRLCLPGCSSSAPRPVPQQHPSPARGLSWATLCRTDRSLAADRHPQSEALLRLPLPAPGVAVAHPSSLTYFRSRRRPPQVSPLLFVLQVLPPSPKLVSPCLNWNIQIVCQKKNGTFR
jgi:hypothetical protein